MSTSGQHSLSAAYSLPMDLQTLACFSGDPDAFKVALNNNITEINKANCGGWTPLMYACEVGNKKGVEILLDLKADENIVNYKGQSAFMIAAMSEHEDILDLLNGDLCMEMADHQGWTPLIGALIMGNYNAVRYLVKKGANVNAIVKDRGATPLILAATEGEERIVQILLAHGADPTFVSKDLKTAADIAYEHGYADLAYYLQDPAVCHSHQRPPKDLLSLLKSIGQEKFWPLFKKNLVDLEQFLEFSEQDLREIGIRILGPRKKMALAIETYNFERAVGLK